MTYYLIADLTFESTDPARNTDEEFDKFTDVIQDELLKLADFDEGIIDPDVTTVISERMASVLIGIEAGNPHDAVRLFSINLRCALHASECSTANWPFEPTTAKPDVRKAEFADSR